MSVIRGAPLKPPSISSNLKKVIQESYVKSLVSVFRNAYFLIFTCTCGKTNQRERERERARRERKVVNIKILLESIEPCGGELE